MKKFYFVLSVFILAFFFLPNTSAIYYHQSIYPNLLDNHTMRYYVVVDNPRTETIITDRLDTQYQYNPLFPLAIFDLNAQLRHLTEQIGASRNDLEGWNFGHTDDKYPYQFFIKYEIYPNSWNTQIGYDYIQYCDLNITKSFFGSILEGVPFKPSQELLSKRVTTSDLLNQEYYIELARGDTAYISIDCYYTNTSERNVLLPANIHVQAPTYSCSKCEAYEWSKLQPTLTKADYLLQANTNNIEYIKKIIFINYDFVVILYWFVIILVVLLAVGMIFLIAYYIYIWLMRLMK